MFMRKDYPGFSHHKKNEGFASQIDADTKHTKWLRIPVSVLVDGNFVPRLLQFPFQFRKVSRRKLHVHRRVVTLSEAGLPHSIIRSVGKLSVFARRQEAHAFAASINA